jgi:hypothetical protein
VVSENVSSSSLNTMSVRPKAFSKKDFAHEKAKSLSINKSLCVIEILPAVRETYEKECQTEDDEEYSGDREQDMRYSDSNAQTPRRPPSRNSMQGSATRTGGSASASKMYLNMDLSAPSGKLLYLPYWIY